MVMMRDTQQPVITKPKPKPKVLSFSEALKDLRDKPIRDADGAWMQWLLDLTVRAPPALAARLLSGGVRGHVRSWCMLDTWGVHAACWACWACGARATWGILSVCHT